MEGSCVMVDPAVLPAFIAAVVVIMITPGPDMMFMIGTGLNAGRKGAVVAAFGVTAGVSVYVVGSAIGLAVLVEQVPRILDGLRIIGAIYLGYLGVTTWRDAGAPTTIGDDSPRDLPKIFRRGFIVNITNPQAALFIAALIPQFIEPSRGNITGQLLTFALAFQAIGLVADLLIGMTAGSTRQLLMQRPSVGRKLDQLAGSVYIAIAVWFIVEAAR